MQGSKEASKVASEAARVRGRHLQVSVSGGATLSAIWGENIQEKRQ